jgi:hypothetical protein
MKNKIKLNEVKRLVAQLIKESDKPRLMGTQHNQVNIIYELTNDDFSYVPSSLEYLDINIDRTLLGSYLPNYNDEKIYQEDIKKREWFFIYYGGKRYVYNRKYKTLGDKSGNKIKSSELDNVSREQLNKIIHNTLNPTKAIEPF